MQLVRNVSQPAALPPGRRGWPIIGETLEFIRDPAFVSKRMALYGPIFQTHLLGRPTAIMVGADANRFILADGKEHFEHRNGMPAAALKLVGQGLPAQDGDAHRRVRTIIEPAFHQRALVHYFDTMQRLTLAALHGWSQSPTVDLPVAARHLTFAIASELLIGRRAGPQMEELGRLFDLTFRGLVAPPIDLPGFAYHRARRAQPNIVRFIARAVAERQQRPTQDALSLLLESRDERGEGLSLQEIQDQALTLMIAGHETTAKLITAFGVILPHHPDILAQLRAEQTRFEGPLSLAQLSEMPYLDQVLREIERYSPPARNGFREVIKPFTFNGCRVPAGWRVIYRPAETHRDSAFFHDPHRFDPERFGPERAEHRKNGYALVAFGGGPRLCIGRAFAQLEMKIIAAAWLRSYRWRCVQPDALEQLNRPRAIYENIPIELRAAP
jgi:cytochrome P450